MRAELISTTHFHVLWNSLYFNALIRAMLISTVTDNSTTETIKPYQYPATGNTHFYRGKTMRTAVIAMYQCPLAGNFHFYWKINISPICLWQCQCPTTGNSHFYPVKDDGVNQGELVYQCPVSGGTHFYHKESSAEQDRKDVSMPYVGQYSFLPLKGWCRMLIFLFVSMPCDEHCSFLLLHLIWTSVWLSMCINALLAGNTHFYILSELMRKMVWFCINALWRAILISTGDNDGNDGRARCINALCRAILISTIYHSVARRLTILYQCPMAGGNHFYRWAFSNMVPRRSCINALSRAVIISTTNMNTKSKNTNAVSMPYGGQFSFLPMANRTDYATRTVSMPCVGRNSFLQCPLETRIKCWCLPNNYISFPPYQCKLTGFLRGSVLFTSPPQGAVD